MSELLCGFWVGACIGYERHVPRVQSENTPEALAVAMEDAAGRVAQHPAEQLDALFSCLSRAMPNLPGRPNFMQEMLGLEVSEVQSSPLPMAHQSRCHTSITLSWPRLHCPSWRTCGNALPAGIRVAGAMSPAAR